MRRMLLRLCEEYISLMLTRITALTAIKSYEECIGAKKHLVLGMLSHVG